MEPVRLDSLVCYRLTLLLPPGTCPPGLCNASGTRFASGTGPCHWTLVFASGTFVSGTLLPLEPTSEPSPLALFCDLKTGDHAHAEGDQLEDMSIGILTGGIRDPVALLGTMPRVSRQSHQSLIVVGCLLRLDMVAVLVVTDC